MPFNSYEFIFAFLPVVAVGFWCTTRFVGYKAARLWLILASLAFYSLASLQSLTVVLLSIVFNYFAARLMAHSSARGARPYIFAVAVIADIALLGYLKYWNFFLGTANALFAMHFELRELLLPLGISFLTFQQIAFLADVHSVQITSSKLRDYLLFMLFFPRTLAGPIIRYREISPQWACSAARVTGVDVVVAMCLFSIGLFKKTVLADGVAELVPDAFESPAAHYLDAPVTFFTGWISAMAYTFELYFDFSGYSDMALGVARLFGIRLPMNFNSPLRASSVIEFWGRWHITLTRFLTDYVYTPLAMHMTRQRIMRGKTVLQGDRSRLSAIAHIVALPTIVTMCISGFWHGVGWQFVVWGALHGFYLTINQTWRILRRHFWKDDVTYARIMTPAGRVLTFLAVVIAMVFFRAHSVSSALAILRGMLGANGLEPSLSIGFGFDLRTYLFSLLPSFAWITFLLLVTSLFPNSLELLRRFQPALDFPKEGPGARLVPEVQGKGTVDAHAVQGARVWWGVPRLFDVYRQIERGGIDLGPAVAMVVAVLTVLGVMAVSGSSAFLYFRF